MERIDIFRHNHLWKNIFHFFYFIYKAVLCKLLVFTSNNVPQFRYYYSKETEITASLCRGENMFVKRVKINDLLKNY